MEIENRKGEGNISFMVSNIEGDMGEDQVMSLIQQADGDVVVIISDPKIQLSVEFCSSSGGGRRPVIAKKLRELIAELAKDEALKTINPIARMQIGKGIGPLEAQAYMETVCYQCEAWPQCQGSNLEGCKRRDDEADRFIKIQGAIDGLKAQGLPKKVIKDLEDWLAREKAKDK